jgi:hypothetical protein
LASAASGYVVGPVSIDMLRTGRTRNAAQETA